MGDQVRNTGDRLIHVVNGWFEALMNAVPRVVVALLLLVVAIVIARLVRRFLRATLHRLKIDDFAARAGLEQPLQRLGINRLSTLLPRLVYGLLLFVFLGAAADAVGLDAVALAIGGVLAYLPNVAVALLLLVFGSWAAQAAGRTVARVAEGSGLDFGAALGRVVAGGVFFVVALTAASQLKIDTDVVRLFTMAGLSGLALAFGLALGLGSRPVVTNVLMGFYARKLFRAGDRVKVGDTDGVLSGITATQTLIAVDESRTVALPNTLFLDQTVTVQGVIEVESPDAGRGAP
jgi:small-conductance mechanosensitive channel